MDKWELIEITLDQLVHQWKSNKESFDLDIDMAEIRVDDQCSEMSIIWIPSAQGDESSDKLLSTDSTKIRKGVMITYNRENEFKCFIFKIDPISKKPITNQLLENSISASRYLIPFRSLYRKFMRLRAEILAHKRHKANNLYMSNLCGVFPGTLDDHLLGGFYDEEED